MTMSALSGYGRHTVVHKFDGDSTTFDTWVDRLCLTLERQQKDLSKVIAGEESITEDDNYQVYLTLCEHIKDEQFNLIKDNFKNKGREAFIHLKQHYKGSPDDIIYTSIKEASNMEKQQDEDITAYFGRLLRIRGALEACKLKLGEHFYLINAMKGLPEDYQAFCAILDTPKTRPATVTEFMSMCRAKESDIAKGDSIMKIRHIHKPLPCRKCGKLGHRTDRCGKLWCTRCKMDNHSDNRCWYRNDHKHQEAIDSTKAVIDSASYTTTTTGPSSSQQHQGCSDSPTEDKLLTFDSDSDTERDIYLLATHQVSDGETKSISPTSLIVDTGASKHLIKDLSLFSKLEMDDSQSKHSIRLANGTTSTGIVRGRGQASLQLKDTTGNIRKIIITDALYIPDFPENIISVLAATKNGAGFYFNKHGAAMEVPDGTIFPIIPGEKLYSIETAGH